MKISVILEALTGSFDTDIARSSKAAKKQFAEFEKSLKQNAKVVGQALLAITGATVAFVKTQSDAIAKFKDLGQQIGDTAANVSSMAAASERANISFDTIASASVNLTANLSKLDDDSKGAGKAIEALGLNFDDFKKLSPVDRLDAVARAMANFKDGTNKTAIAVALLGKNGAELLPFLAEFAEEQQHISRVTDEQAEAADRLNDQIAGAEGLASQYKNALALGLIPVFSRLLDSFNDATKGTDDFSEATRTAATFGKVIASAFIVAKGVLVGFAKELAGIAAATTTLFKGVSATDLLNPFVYFYKTAKNAGAAVGILKDTVGQLSDEGSADLKALQKVWDDTMAPIAKAAGKSELPSFTPIETKPARGGGGGVVPLVMDDYVRQMMEAEEATRATIDTIEDMVPAIADIAPEAEAASAAVVETADAMSTAWDEATRSMQGALSDFLFDPFQDGLKGMLKSFGETLRRMAADAAAAQIMDAVLGKQGQNGSRSGGWIDSAIKWASEAWSAYSASGGGKAMGGPVSGGTPYLVGERGPEMFVPGVSGSIIPNSKMGGVTNHFAVTVMAPEGRIDKRSNTQLRHTLGSAVADSMRRNG